MRKFDNSVNERAARKLLVTCVGMLLAVNMPRLNVVAVQFKEDHQNYGTFWFALRVS